jgi:hypothetical protein
VRGETWTFLRRKAGHRAIEWLRTNDEREHSSFDVTSFALMRHPSLRVVPP